MSNIKSMGDGFVVEEDETERQQPSAVSGSPVSRNRPLVSDSSGPLVSDSSGKVKAPVSDTSASAVNQEQSSDGQ